MKKNIWIWNHYATNMYKDQAGRHYWFAENLKEKGYNPTIFCASTVHNSNENIKDDNKKYISKKVNDIPFVFVKTNDYQGNGRLRIKNMIAFYWNLFPVAKKYIEQHGKPDVIYASSVHPLTLVAAIKIAKKLGIPCICEVRDLWPESLVAYGTLKRENIIAKILYRGEKWIYKKADSIIMTWQGGKQYIIDQGWADEINLKKVYHISNGVVVKEFDENSQKYAVNDPDLDNENYKNIVYAGSIRRVNNIGLLLDAAKLIQSQNYHEIKFLIYGSGDELDKLKERCRIERIDNVIFKGRIEKKYIPSILKKSYINLLHNSSTTLDKYGQSQNKFFEYLAAGRCIVQTYTTGYSILDEVDGGINVPIQNAEGISKILIEACVNEAENKRLADNTRKAIYKYDFSYLTDQLVDVIENAR